MSADDPRGGAFALSTFELYEQKTRSVNGFSRDRAGFRQISGTFLNAAPRMEKTFVHFLYGKQMFSWGKHYFSPEMQTTWQMPGLDSP